MYMYVRMYLHVEPSTLSTYSIITEDYGKYGKLGGPQGSIYGIHNSPNASPSAAIIQNRAHLIDLQTVDL